MENVVKSRLKKYYKSITEEQNSSLKNISKTIKNKLPCAEESFDWGMPVFKYKGKYLIGIGAFKNHMSIFPGSEAIEILKNDLKDYKISKGTIQFTNSTPISEKLLTKIINERIKLIDKSLEK